MAVHLNVEIPNGINKSEQARLHSVPCIIKCNEDAKVSVYFEPVITPVKDGIFQSSFRGCLLYGKELNVPNNYTGMVLQETGDKLSEGVDRNLYKIHSFDKFTYWNWDTEPSPDDSVVMALDWLDIAPVLHERIDKL